MPPCALVENAVFDSEEPTSDALKYREFAVLIFPQCHPLRNYTGGIFPMSDSGLFTLDDGTESIPPVSQVEGDPTAHREL